MAANVPIPALSGRWEAARRTGRIMDKADMADRYTISREPKPEQPVTFRQIKKRHSTIVQVLWLGPNHPGLEQRRH